MSVVDFHHHWRQSAKSRKNVWKVAAYYEFCLVKNYASIFEIDNAQAVI